MIICDQCKTRPGKHIVLTPAKRAAIKDCIRRLELCAERIQATRLEIARK